MIRKKWRALTVGCCLILILTVSILILASTNLQQAQIPITSQPKTVTVVDDLGRNVTVKYPVERIVSLASSISEVICAIGYEEGLVGVDAHSTFPPILKEKVNLGSGATPSVELTVGLQPDIVFAWYYCEVVEEIEKHNIPVYLIKVSSIDDILKKIELIGYLTAQDKRAHQVISFIEKYVLLVSERTKTLNEDKKPLVYFEFRKPYATGNKKTFTHEMVTLAGGINIAAEEPVQYPLLSSEYVVAKNPDIIIKYYYTPEPSKEEEARLRDEICSRPGWGDINAVKNGKIYVLHFSEGSLNPRLVIGLLKYAKWIQPELFKDVDVEKVQNTLMKEFYVLEG